MPSSVSRLINVDKLKAEIFEAINIVEVAEDLGIELQAAGEQWRALCPLHEENTPSWYVNPHKGQGGVYHCFGCKASGDTIDLVEQVRHLSFVEALHYLAPLADVEIEDYKRPLTEAEQAQEEFREWCERWMASSSAESLPMRVGAVGALFGVVSRTKAQATQAPSYFREKDYLLDGTVLPWRTPGGRLAGWRLREHYGNEKRVIGTPNDFPLGKISETLFGIQVAREHIQDGTLLLVEGEYDAIACHEHGFGNAAGMGGSSLTEAQMEMLESLRVRRVVMLFDGDDGGRLAAKACAEKYWAHNISVLIAICPEGEDPESVLTQHGDWALQSIVNSATLALEYLLRMEFSARDTSTLSAKLEYVKWIRDTYGARLRSADESLVLSEVARWLAIPELEVRDYVRSADTSLCAVDSERMLLGRACRDQQFYVHLRSVLRREDLFVLKHQRVWDLLADMLIDGQEFDPITVAQRSHRYGLPDGYIDGLLSLPEANLDYHRRQVADLSLRRSARDDALAFKEQITDLNQPAELLVGDLTHKVTTKALNLAGMSQRQLVEQVDIAMDTLHERMENPDEIHGLNLGMQYPQLSRTLQGLQRKRLVLLSAISGMGKSTMLITWAASLAVHRSIPIDLVSLEMDETEMLFKLASHITGIDSMKISGGRLEPMEAKAVEYAMLRIRNAPLHIWAPDGLTQTEFLLYAREAVMQRRTQAFFIDYVQLIDPEPGQERDNGYKLYGDFGRMCKMKVARSMDVSVVCCAQLNRNASAKERPTKEDMGDSYALVRHADVIVIITGEEDAHTVDLWVDKNRQGPAGNVLIPMAFWKPISTFNEASAPKLPEYRVTA